MRANTAIGGGDKIKRWNPARLDHLCANQRNRHGPGAMGQIPNCDFLHVPGQSMEMAIAAIAGGSDIFHDVTVNMNHI